MTPRPRPSKSPRGFTLVEVMIAVLIASFVFMAIYLSIGQLSRTRSTSRARLQAHVRADAAINALRRDIASVIRNDDLFWTRLLIRSNAIDTPQGLRNRDELLVFNTRLRSMRNDEFQGEGIQYETHYRIIDDADGPVLWQRRDAIPDEYPEGGGIVTPQVDGVAGIRFRAYDGEIWYDEWDSDYYGLPWGVEITVTVPITDSPFDIPVQLKTIVSIDRVLPPFDAQDDEADEDAGASGGGP